MKQSKNKQSKKKVEQYSPLQVQQTAAGRHLNLNALLTEAWTKEQAEKSGA